MKGRWVVIVGDGEDAEAFGPFTSQRFADELAERYTELAIRPYDAIVVELWSPHEMQKQIREEPDA